MELSRLTKVYLREAWPHETSDFTTWLAEEENLQLLSVRGLAMQYYGCPRGVLKRNTHAVAETGIGMRFPRNSLSLGCRTTHWDETLRSIHISQF